jgi:hypothetical protein
MAENNPTLRYAKIDGLASIDAIRTQLLGLLVTTA